MNRPDAYLETSVLTARPYQLHLMVLDAAIRHGRQAAAALETQDLGTAHVALGQARDFLSELISGLDPQHAPELVTRLKELFVFVYRQFALADFDQNVERVREGLKVLGIHRETWLELAEALTGAEMPATIPVTASTAPPVAPVANDDAPYQSRSWSA